MVLLFSGRGYVVPIVWVGSVVLTVGVLEMETGTAAVLSNMFTGLLCTWLGVHWRQQEIHKAALEEVPLKHKRHSFFFVPMRYIWIPALLWSLIAVVQSYQRGTLHW